jgi:hypothetical protein
MAAGSSSLSSSSGQISGEGDNEEVCAYGLCPKSSRSRVDRVEERGRGTWYTDFPKHGTIGVYSFSTFHVNLGRVPGTTTRNAIAVNSSST